MGFDDANYQEPPDKEEYEAYEKAEKRRLSQCSCSEGDFRFCHGKVSTLELQNGELLAALVALADRVSVRFGETIKYEPVATGRYLDAAYEAIAKAKVAVAQKPVDVKARLALIENGKCPECGEKAHLHNCTEKRSQESPKHGPDNCPECKRQEEERKNFS